MHSRKGLSFLPSFGRERERESLPSTRRGNHARARKSFLCRRRCCSLEKGEGEGRAGGVWSGDAYRDNVRGWRGWFKICYFLTQTYINGRDQQRCWTDTLDTREAGRVPRYHIYAVVRWCYTRESRQDPRAWLGVLLGCIAGDFCGCGGRYATSRRRGVVSCRPA